MMNIERQVLAPSSHSSLQSRFSLPRAGVIHSPSLVLEVGITTSANAWFIPRCGGWGVIQQIELLKDGATVSFVNRVDAWAALKSLAIGRADMDSFEAQTKAAVITDVPEIGSPPGGSQGALGCDSHIVQYRAAAFDKTVAESGAPLLNLSYIFDYFAKNKLIDLSEGKYELLVNWQQQGGLQPAGTTTFQVDAVVTNIPPVTATITADTRLLFSLITSPVNKKLTEPMPFYEMAFTSEILPALNANVGDNNQLNLRIHSRLASALFLAFVDNTAQAVYSAPVNCLGQARSQAFSVSNFTMQVFVKGASVLPRPLSQDSERAFELGMALDLIGGMGPLHYSAPLFAGGRLAFTPAMRSHQLINPGASANNVYYGFRLTENGKPIMLDANGIQLQLQRVASAVAVNQLTVYAFVI